MLNVGSSRLQIQCHVYIGYHSRKNSYACIFLSFLPPLSLPAMCLTSTQPARQSNAKSFVSKINLHQSVHSLLTSMDILKEFLSTSHSVCTCVCTEKKRVLTNWEKGLLRRYMYLVSPQKMGNPWQLRY